MPDYVPLFFAAEECGSQPWELVDLTIPRRVWAAWALLVAEARGRAREMQTAESRTNPGATRTPI